MAAMATSTITGLSSSLSLSRPSSKAAPGSVFFTSKRSSHRNVVTCRYHREEFEYLHLPDLYIPLAVYSPLEIGREYYLKSNYGLASWKYFPQNWLRRDLNVIGFGLIGWLTPSSIPAINGNSLTGLFFSSIGEELAHFPTGPALSSPFWLWLVTWHLGLFICLTFGQIGFKGRTEGYF